MDWKQRQERKGQCHSCAVRMDGHCFHVLLGEAGGRAKCLSQASSGTTHTHMELARGLTQHLKTSKGSLLHLISLQPGGTVLFLK